ncbi:hypothetical protein KC906_01325 [Candidatus Kaiserbacteria bacterium]|nr:hypothetical protein [Candidatus Kaiserbacteria bacterium]MCB9812608.1 hypothetical protein [Candidatus Nomurabacteria bacterium]
METVTYDGVDYVKASAAAKEFRYTSDYIGQLCRTGKVNARLVGRTWFVDVDSLQTHRKNRHMKTTGKSRIDYTEDLGVGSKIKPSRITVDSVPNAKTIHQALQPQKHQAERQRMLAVSYERDEEALLPSLIKKKLMKPKVVRVEIAGAKKVRVGGPTRLTTFTATDVPEVALSGELKVTTYQAQPETPKKIEQDDLSDKRDNPKNKSILNKISDSSAKRKLMDGDGKRSQQTAFVETRVDDVRGNASVTRTSGSALAQPSLDFTPVTTLRVPRLQRVNVFLRFSPVIATVVAILCVAAIFSASGMAVVTDSSYQAKVVLQVANLLEILRQ